MFGYIPPSDESSPWYSQRYNVCEKLDRAADRTLGIAKSEQYLGYDESASSYFALAEELAATKMWFREYKDPHPQSDGVG